MSMSGGDPNSLIKSVSGYVTDDDAIRIMKLALRELRRGGVGQIGHTLAARGILQSGLQRLGVDTSLSAIDLGWRDYVGAYDDEATL